jgi:hypothetical protein
MRLWIEIVVTYLIMGFLTCLVSLTIEDDDPTPITLSFHMQMFLTLLVVWPWALYHWIRNTIEGPPEE